MIDIVLVLIISYFLGSIPFSHIFPKLKGKDVKSAGTKNVGATNALVVAGPFMGALALIGDIGKGYLVVYLATQFSNNLWVIVFAGLLAIIGHDFSIFLKFKGGKGVATTGGVLLAFDPILAIIILLIWLLMILITRYFILSTIIILGAVPIMMLVLAKPIQIVVFALLAFVLALITHRIDVYRFITGKELKTSEAINRYMK